MFLSIKENKEKILEYYKSHKSREKTIILICPNCLQNFTTHKHYVQISFSPSSDQNKIYCSKKCQTESQITNITVPCGYCGTEVTRNLKEYKKSKSGHLFCNSSCACKYNNQHVIRSDKKLRKSYAETYLYSLLSNKYNFEIQQNVRNLMKDGLEIDILIPSLNLAIELNGPLHYFSIYGEEKLKQIQNRDIKKQIYLQRLNYNIIIIDISKISGKKKTENFINQYYESHLKEIIKSLQKD